jgi:chromate transporter
MTLLFLYAEFFKIGLFSIGGGLATLPFLYQLAENHDWLTPEMIGNIQAVAQVLPGAIGVNMAAHTGFQCAGTAGAFVSAFGLISPSIIVILIVARTLQNFKENKSVKAVFAGLRPAACGLIAVAGLGAIKLVLHNENAQSWYELLRLRESLIFAVILFLVLKFNLNPIIYIAVCAVIGIIFLR